MNFLGIGPGELILILALALIVFGPSKLPEVGAQIGRAARDFRRVTSELSAEFNRNIQLEVEEQKQKTRPPASEHTIHSGQAESFKNGPTDFKPHPRGQLEKPAASKETESEKPAGPKESDSDLAPPY